MFVLRTITRSRPSVVLALRASPISRTFVSSPVRLASPFVENAVAPEASADPAKEQLTLQDLTATGHFSKKLIAALDKAKFTTLTPVQSKSLLPILEAEQGLVVRAKTGTGKTLAFVIPTIQDIIEDRSAAKKGGKGKIATLVIAPTRDLAMQIEGEYKKVIAGLTPDLQRKTKIALLMGGKRTEFDYKYPPNIVIATPGRLEDKLSNPRFAQAFSAINYRVYDEADRILDVGFKDSLDNIDRMLKEARATYQPDLPPFKSILFSATIDKAVDEFARKQIHPTYNYINCVDENEGEAHENIHQTLVETKDTIDSYQSALSYTIKNMNEPNFKAIVFLPTITAVEWLYSALKSARTNEVYDTIVHKKYGSKMLKLNGKMSQTARDNSVRHFRNAKHGILVCTDVAARGLDFSDVSHVIQLAPSPSVADYIHKIGRTARAGAKGKAIIFLTKPEYKFKKLLEKQRGIEFAEQIKSSEIEQIENVFDKLALDEEEIESFIRTFLGFQKQVASVFRLDFDTMVADVIKFYRLLIKDPEARLFVTKNFVSQILNIDFRLAEQYFEAPGGFGRGSNNRSAKRNTFSGGNKSYSRDRPSFGGNRDRNSYGGNRDRDSYRDNRGRDNYRDNRDRDNYRDNRGGNSYGNRSYGSNSRSSYSDRSNRDNFGSRRSYDDN